MTVCPHCGCVLEPPAKARRSLQQNAYWHGVVITLLAEHFGYTHEECHEAVRDHFLGRDDLSTGLRVPGSTKRLSTNAFTKLIDDVRIWAHTEHNCYIPAPNEVPEEWMA